MSTAEVAVRRRGNAGGRRVCKPHDVPLYTACRFAAVFAQRKRMEMSFVTRDTRSRWRFARIATAAFASGALAVTWAAPAATPAPAPGSGPQSVTIIGNSNVLLSDGASELEAGHVAEGLRLTLAGLQQPAAPRDLAAGHANACAAFVELRQLQDALQHCNLAIGIDNANWRAFNNRAAVYVAQGLYDLAIRDIETGLAIAPHSRTLLESLRVARRNKRIVEGHGRRSVPS